MLYINNIPLNVTVFPDNTSQVWKLPFSQEEFDFYSTSPNPLKIKWIYSNESDFLHLAQLKDLLDHYYLNSILEITYLPYARQDKEVSDRSTFALNTFAKLLNALQFSSILIHDPHSEKAISLINNSQPIYPISRITNLVGKTNSEIICYPDKGAKEKYSKLFPLFAPITIYGEKVRDQLTGYITSYKLIGECNNKNVLIVDDICDGGMTFKLLAKDLLAAGAKEVNLFVTHGIFSKGTRTLFESGINRVFTKDEEISKRSTTFHI